jgi:hypothetical protein
MLTVNFEDLKLLLIHVFIYAFFSDAVGGSGYTASKIISEKSFPEYVEGNDRPQT